MKSPDRTLQPADALVGEVDLPADKSIAHRSALISAISEGASMIVGYPSSADPQSTLSCLRALGVEMAEQPEGLAIRGRGLHGLRAPASDLDCGNSGTTMRLLAGILAGQPFDSRLIGDASLSKRPMQRVIDPLRLMGADLEAQDGRPPLDIRRCPGLKGIHYPLPVASAQVKSCVLLAGLFADGETT
ncbi:MAG: 3-phosphoshikimate 1-carboxyvinyltransferase, partial [Bacteroidetes bacterium]|nr:3-phosphoshikimate 1-carboxyvinyltransferase [Bacteroidota bacterium]